VTPLGCKEPVPQGAYVLCPLVHGHAGTVVVAEDGDVDIEILGDAVGVVRSPAGVTVGVLVAFVGLEGCSDAHEPNGVALARDGGGIGRTEAYPVVGHVGQRRVDLRRDNRPCAHVGVSV